MLLVEEVKLLRQNLSRIKELTFATPLMGGGVELAYEFVMYMALARNIYDKIKMFGDRYPVLRRNFENRVGGISNRIAVNDVLNKIIHGSYIEKSERDLHVESDEGEVYIIDSEEFKSILDTLCLSDNESVFIMCQILRYKVEEFQTTREEDVVARESLKLRNQMRKYLMWMINTHSSSEEVSRELSSRLFPENSVRQFVPTYCYEGSDYGSFQSPRFNVQISCRWDKDGVEINDSKTISLYDFLLLIENHTGQN